MYTILSYLYLCLNQNSILTQPVTIVLSHNGNSANCFYLSVKIVAGIWRLQLLFGVYRRRESGRKIPHVGVSTFVNVSLSDVTSRFLWSV